MSWTPPPDDDDDRDDATQILMMDEVAKGRLFVEARDRVTLTVLQGPNPGAVHTMQGDEVVVGRGSKADFVLNDAGLSRLHARVFRIADSVYSEDLGSTNGTFVDGERLGRARLLVDGDRIALGPNSVLKFSLHDALEQKAAVQLYESTVRDGLTGCYNRRYLDDRLHQEFAYSRRHGTTLSLLILDIDHFKRVNDTLGHQAGDEVLRQMASALSPIVRAEDIVARYGGEEFAVIARGIDRFGAGVLGERIRCVVEQLEILWKGERVPITLSAGAATAEPRESSTYGSVAELVSAADEALYHAKGAGRNRVVLAS